MKVICISGHAQHGKDTTANLLRSYLHSMQKKAIVIHYADLLKFMCKTYFGWNGEKDDAGRTLLQYVGTDVVRKQCPDFWCDFVTKVLKLFPNEWEYVIIADCRFPNEIECMQESGFDTKHVRVFRPNFKSPLTDEQQKHPSETALENYPSDYIICNYGTEIDLLREVQIFVQEVLKI